MEDKRTELVFGLVGAIGTRLDRVAEALRNLLQSHGYDSETIKVSRDIIAELPTTGSAEPRGHYERASHFMDAGNRARKSAGNAAILAHGIANHIASKRPFSGSRPVALPGAARYGHAYVIDSLKNPAEVHALRDIYSHAFYLIGVHEELATRSGYLTQELSYTAKQVDDAVRRDEDEKDEFGQQTANTFELSDFFLATADGSGRTRGDLMRFLDIIFGDPEQTAHFDEYAMFLAYAASLRSGDVARQVGAVLASPEREILALGSNDVPAYGGGPYWHDTPVGDYRDIKLGAPGGANTDPCEVIDPNKREIARIVSDIGDKVRMEDLAGALRQAGVDMPSSDAWHRGVRQVIEDAARSSRLGDLTEFGRSVHAEMEALLTCSRYGASTRGATLYCTTFPCHNCAKHIVDAGLRRVVYVEPYAKSLACELHPDALQLGAEAGNEQTRVWFEHFAGVGPRRFLDLFSLKLGVGRRLSRKSDAGARVGWDRATATPRLQLEPRSYLDNEKLSGELLAEWRRQADAE